MTDSIFCTARRAAALALAAAALAACSSDDPTAPQFGQLTGSFAGTVAEGATATTTFTAGRSGPTHVEVCGETGEEIGLTVGTATGAALDEANCARVEFDAVRGRSYEVEIRSVEGAGGNFTGCWATSLVECHVATPAAGTCMVRPFSADTTLPAGYYDAAEGWTGLRFAEELHYITCSQRIPADPDEPFYEDQAYAHARDSLYDYVDDPDDDDVIVDLYTGRAADVSTRSEAAAADFNAEHLWPQSLGAENLPARSDLHHLFSSDETANGQRSNHPFGEVVTVQWAGPVVTLPGGGTEQSLRGLDAEGRTVFEPRDSKKGDVARAILYFYVRYAIDPTIPIELENFEIERETLLQWAAQDPPDTFEQQRNALVFRAQGNRNPFVDHPEWVELLGEFLM